MTKAICGKPVRTLDDLRPDPVADTDPLPFTSGLDQENGARLYWDVDPTGDWEQDCNLGSECARIYAYRRNRGLPCPEPAWIIEDMIRVCSQRSPELQFSGIECAFVQELFSPPRTRAGSQPPEADVRMAFRPQE